MTLVVGEDRLEEAVYLMLIRTSCDHERTWWPPWRPLVWLDLMVVCDQWQQMPRLEHGVAVELEIMSRLQMHRRFCQPLPCQLSMTPMTAFDTLDTSDCTRVDQMHYHCTWE